MTQALSPPSNYYARIRPHIRVVAESGDLLLLGDQTFRVVLRDPRLRKLVDRLCCTPGLHSSELRSVAGDPGERLLQHLLRLKVAQLRLEPFSAAPLEGTEGYLSALVGPDTSAVPLQARAVLIIGCGGLGGELARHLVASGVGRLALIDPDDVHASNLNRQYLFTRRDLGRPKAEAARDALLALNPKVQLSVHRRWIGSTADLAALGEPSVDAVVCCADLPMGKIQVIAAEHALAQRSIFAMGSVGVDQGSWGPILSPSHRLSYGEWVHQHPAPTSDESAWQPVAASFGPTNSWIAAALAADLVHVLIGLKPPSLGCKIVMNFQTLAIERRPITLELPK
jgi:hypothetical protein